MSLADLRWFRKFRRKRSQWEGMRPPPATPGEIYRDLKWHWSVYKEDEIPVRDRLLFLGLRVVQRVSYNIGWYLGKEK